MSYESLRDLYDGLHALLVEVTGLDATRVILGSQGRPAPEGLGTYVVYKPYVIRAVGHPARERELVPATEDFNDVELGADWEDFEEVVVTSMNVMLSVSVLNRGASNIIWRLHNANFLWPVQERLFTMGIAWRYVSENRRLSEVSQAGIESRHQTDVFLYVPTAIKSSVLRAASFSVKIEDEAGNVIYDGE